jgi:hypothetical protein
MYFVPNSLKTTIYAVYIGLILSILLAYLTTLFKLSGYSESNEVRILSRKSKEA